MFQRPQHLLTRAAESMNVIFVEEPWAAMELSPGADPTPEVLPRGESIRVVRLRFPEGLDHGLVTERQAELAARLVAEDRGSPRLFWYYTPMALEFTADLRSDLVIFDKMDELSAFKNAPPRLLELEAELLRRADVVFTGGASMHAAAAHRHGNIHCFPSSIDRAHFAGARDGSLPDPADQAGIPHPRVGFFGVIDERLDVELVGEVARRRPDWQFVMIGPVVKIDPAVLPRAPNLHWLGGRDYQELPAYLAHWDAGFMPFAMNEATRFISPTKTPEFLAAGLPVVSTPITDVVSPYGDSGLVHIAADADQMVGAIAASLGAPADDWLARVDAKLAVSSWSSTWDQMDALITHALDARPTGGGSPARPQNKESARV